MNQNQTIFELDVNGLDMDSEYDELSSDDSEDEEYEAMDIVDDENDESMSDFEDFEDAPHVVLKVRGPTEEEDHFMHSYNCSKSGVWIHGEISEKLLGWLMTSADLDQRWRVTHMNAHLLNALHLNASDFGVDDLPVHERVYVSTELDVDSPTQTYSVSTKGFHLKRL